MTPDIQKEITSLIEEAFRQAAERGLLPRIELPPVELAVPREKNKGDLASNIAMKSASRLKLAPSGSRGRLQQPRSSRRATPSRTRRCPRPRLSRASRAEAPHQRSSMRYVGTPTNTQITATPV